MAPPPVTIRTLDINGDKAIRGHRPTMPSPTRPWGCGAIRYCLKRPDVFRTQLRAILRAAVHGDVRIMFPMISTYFELARGQALLDEAGRGAGAARGCRTSATSRSGIMIEVPSAVVIADLLAEEVDFFSIGTNDLIQYSLAIDRGNEQVAHLYQPLRSGGHPHDQADRGRGARQPDRRAHVRRDGRPPLYAPLLLGLGLDDLSMNPQAIPTVKRMIRSISLSDARGLIHDVLACKTAKQAFDLLTGAYGSLVENHRSRSDAGFAG